MAIVVGLKKRMQPCVFGHRAGMEAFEVTIAAKEMGVQGLDSPMPFQRKAGHVQKKKCPSL